MREMMRKFVPVFVGASIGALVVATAGFAQGVREVREGPAEPVYVVGPDPLSVSGDVSATLDEPVEVTAGGNGLAVDVASLESRLDTIASTIEASSPAPPGEPFTAYCRLILGADQEGYCALDGSGPGAIPPTGPPSEPAEMLIGSITVGSEDDELDLDFFKDGELIAPVANSFSNNINGPILHLTYPVPVEADVITVDCNNESEGCQVLLTVVGYLQSNG